MEDIGENRGPSSQRRREEGSRKKEGDERLSLTPLIFSVIATEFLNKIREKCQTVPFVVGCPVLKFSQH